jgi:UDP-N-acetyl-D-glucosamine/UDP-N-acetyl-D-galactosamine dehydrogenase
MIDSDSESYSKNDGSGTELEERTVQYRQEENEDRHVVCVIGQGYVGLPLAFEFDRTGHGVIGYDIDSEKIAQLRSGVDPTGDVGDDEVTDCDIEFTDDEETISRAEFFLVTVPTPINELNNPNLEYVESAGETIGRQIASGAVVVLESTVYPGATREVLVPAIERTADMKAGEQFYVGYSPERVVPGDGKHAIRNLTKIVSGQNNAALEKVVALYETIIEPGVHRAPEIEVAEAAKCVENVQRDLNIALVNELAVAFDALDLDVGAVLEAAGTKWNFHDYRPGLVGGHCIPVDPFYVIYQAERHGFTPRLMRQAREVNDSVPEHVADLVLRSLNRCSKVPKESTVLVLGLAYKPGVGDVRSSAVDGTVASLEEFDVDVVGFDPYTENEIMRSEFGIEIQDELSFNGVDGVLLATPHECFRSVDYRTAAAEMSGDPFVVDVNSALDSAEMTEIGFDYRRL